MMRIILKAAKRIRHNIDDDSSSPHDGAKRQRVLVTRGSRYSNDAYVWLFFPL
jgi:hypothetical protein